MGRRPRDGWFPESWEGAERQPVLAVWEDLHWADPSTLELLGLLIDQTPTVPILHVLTFRPEFVPPWSQRSHLTPITLNRLERPQVEAFITHLASGKTLPSEVVEHIVSKTDGVPLFVEELTKMLLESGLLHKDGDGYTLSGPLSTVPIPATLQDSLMARLDQLGQAKEVAQLGAVLGREFAYDMLQALAEVDESTLQEGLGKLVEAELLYQRGRPPRSRYIFKHALSQDAAYQTLLKRTRQQAHQQIARLLETKFPETVEMQPELVAHHFTAAGRPEPAMAYWQRAGLRANGRSAYPEAVACFDQALEALRTLPERRDTMEQVIDLCLQLRHALFPLRNFDRLLDILREAETLEETLDDARRLALVTSYIGHYFWITGEPTRAMISGQRAADIADEFEDFSLQITTNHYLGAFHHTVGNYQQAIHLFARTVAFLKGDLNYQFFDMGGLPSVLSRNRLAACLAEIGEFNKAIVHGEEGVRIAESVNHPFSLSNATYGIGYVYLLQGQFSKAISGFQALLSENVR